MVFNGDADVATLDLSEQQVWASRRSVMLTRRALRPQPSAALMQIIRHSKHQMPVSFQ